MLIRDDSLLHRASGLTREGRQHSFSEIQKHIQFNTTIPEMLKAKKLPKSVAKDVPLFTDGLRVWNVHRSFTEGYIDLLYPDEEALLSDTDLLRFWSHVNTLGRHTDPCVCGMDGSLFFEEGVWPAFEETRTCAGLLEHQGIQIQGDESKKREEWCLRQPVERTRALYNWLEDDCKDDEGCTELPYDFHHMRSDMGLPAMSRESVIDLLTTFMFEVTAGHEMAADNIPYMADPSYANVRIASTQGSSVGEVPLMADISTYIFGNVISTLTTIRSMPLLSDWSNLLVGWIDGHKKASLSDDLSDKGEKKKKLKSLLQLEMNIKNLHLKYKSDLVILSNELVKETLKKPWNQRAPYFIPATQASSVAV